MEYFFDKDPEAGGIYALYCKRTNKSFIGATTNFKYCWNDIRKALDCGKFKNKAVQSDFLLYGHLAFSFRVIHTTTQEYLLSAIKRLIKESGAIYNTEKDIRVEDENYPQKIVEPEPVPVNNYNPYKEKLTQRKDELADARRFGDMIREQLKQRYLTDEEYRKQVDAINLEKLRKEQEEADKRREYNAQRALKRKSRARYPERVYTLIDKDGTEIQVSSINSWCKQKGYSQAKLYALINGKVLSAYGYTIPESLVKKKLDRLYSFKSPSGEVHETADLLSLCKQYNLPVNHMIKVAWGFEKHCSGWIRNKSTKVLY